MHPTQIQFGLCTGVFMLCDSLISIFSLGLYHHSFRFDTTELIRNLLVHDGYSFVRSPIDFVPLLLFRFAFLLSLLFSRFMFPCSVPTLSSQPFKLTLIGIVIVNFSLSLVKLLALSDVPAQLLFPGIWLSTLWNIGAFLAVYAIYHFAFCNERQTSNGGAIHATDDEVNYQRISSVEEEETRESEKREEEGAENEEPTESSSRWAHVRYLLGHCVHYWRWLLLGFFFLFVFSIARIFTPLFTARVISTMVRARQLDELVNSVLLMASALAITILTGGLRAGTVNYVTAKINRRMRRDLFRAISAQEIAFFDRAQTGEILSRLIADCETMSATLSSSVDIFLRNGLMVLGSVGIMLGMSWRLTAVTLVLIPPIAFFTKLYAALYDKLAERAQASKASANRIAEEVVSSMRNVRAFAAERKEQTRFEQQLDATLAVDKTKSMALIGFLWVNDVANDVILVAILFYGGYLVISGRMSADQMFAFLLYQLQLGENFYMLNSVATGLMESVGASRKVFEYLARKPRIPIHWGQLRPAEVHGKLEFRNVSFAYPTRPNTLVLKNVSFVVHPGEMVALVGPSGAGKSTVIALLEHFYEPSEGQVLLDDVPIADWEHEYFHRKVALVSQEPTLYACSIRENILYGCDCEQWAIGEREMLEAARLANIHQFVMEHTEHGYDTSCGEKGVQMSGGQKQRIAIARALVRHPAVLLLDEATSALDARAEHAIREALAQRTEGRSVLLIAHRLSTVERADRIIVMEHGQIVQIGSHAELMAQPEGLYRALVQRQLLGSSEH